jgi:Flp pilus assembly pilin Flp
LRTVRGLIRDDRGAATAEYAIATMAAVGLAGVLVGILKGNVVQQLLTNLITGALTLGG